MVMTFQKSCQQYLIASIIGMAGLLQAAIEIIDSPTYASATTQIRTQGTVVYAYTANNFDRTINGVTFTQVNANQTSWGAGNVTLSGASGSSATRGAPYDTKVPDADYRGLLTGLVFDAVTPCVMNVTLNNLIAGQSYIVQIWASDSTSYASTRETKYTISNGTESGEFTLDLSDTGGIGGVGQFATFKFTAQGTSVGMLLTGAGAGTMAAIAALQVRSTLPTVQTWIGADDATWNTTGLNWSDATEFDTIWLPGYPFMAIFTNEASVALSGTLGADRLQANTNLTLFGAESSLRLNGLSVTGRLAVSELTLSLRQGLVYRLDASDASRITTYAATNRIQTWSASHGTFTFGASVVPGLSDTPTYDASAFGGRGGVVFGNGELYQWPSTRLEANAATNAQTVIFVAKPSTIQNDLAGAWGHAGNDTGLRTSGSANWGAGGGTFHGTAGGAHYLNGVAYAYNVAAPYTSGQPQIYTSLSASLRTVWTHALGNYWNSATYTNRFWRGELAEVLVYDRKLTESERITLETILAAKWGISGYSALPVPQVDAIVVTNNATMNLDGSVLVVGEAVLGDATIQQGLLVATNGVRITGDLVLDGQDAAIKGSLVFEPGTTLTVTNQTRGVVFTDPVTVDDTVAIFLPEGVGIDLYANMSLSFDGATVPLIITGGGLAQQANAVLTLELGATVLVAGTNTLISGYVGAAPVLYPIAPANLPVNGMARLAVEDNALKLIVEVAIYETTLTVATPATLVYGQPIPVTATVRGPEESIPEGGTISFFSPDNLIVPLATLDIDANGEAVYEVTERLSVGTGYTYLAKFNGYSLYLYSGQEASAGLAITPRPVTIEAAVATNRLYDATTDAYALATVQAGDILSGDELTVWAVGDFADAEPGEAKTFTANRAILTGGAASNYTANAFSFADLAASVVTNALWNGTAGDYTWTQTHQNWLPGGGIPSQSKPFGPSAGWRNHVTWTNSGQNAITLKDTVYVGSFAATGLRAANIYNPESKQVVFPPEGGAVWMPIVNNVQIYEMNCAGQRVLISGSTGITGHQWKGDNSGVTNLTVYFTGVANNHFMFNGPRALGGPDTTVTLQGNRDGTVALNLGVYELTGTGYVYSVANTILAGGLLRSRVGTNTWSAPISVISNSWIAARQSANVLFNLDGAITVNEGATNFFNHTLSAGIINLNSTVTGQAEQSYGTLNLARSNTLAQAYFAYNGGAVGWTAPGATLYQIGALNGTASANLSLPEGLTLELGCNDLSGSHAGGLSATGTVRKVGSGLAKIRANSTYANLELAGGTFGTGLGYHTVANLVMVTPTVVSVDVGAEQTSGRLILSQDTDLSSVTLAVGNPGDLSKAADYPVVEFTAGSATAYPQVAATLKNQGWKLVADESNPNVLELRFLPGTVLLLR